MRLMEIRIQMEIIDDSTVMVDSGAQEATKKIEATGETRD